MGSYLLVPAEEHAHCLAAAFAAATGMNLRETGRLGGDVAFRGCRCSVGHAFVAVNTFVSRRL